MDLCFVEQDSTKSCYTKIISFAMISVRSKGGSIDMDYVLENIGKRIAESRRSAGFTQEELANRLGVTPQALSKWEKGD